MIMIIFGSIYLRHCFIKTIYKELWKAEHFFYLKFLYYHLIRIKNLIKNNRRSSKLWPFLIYHKLIIQFSDPSWSPSPQIDHIIKKTVKIYKNYSKMTFSTARVVFDNPKQSGDRQTNFFTELCCIFKIRLFVIECLIFLWAPNLCQAYS